MPNSQNQNLVVYNLVVHHVSPDREFADFLDDIALHPLSETRMISQFGERGIKVDRQFDGGVAVVLRKEITQPV